MRLFSREATLLLVVLVPIALSFISSMFTNRALEAIRARNNAISLLGRRAVVVGGTTGIGRGIALRLARANATVTVVGRNAAAGEQLVQEMNGVSSVQHEFISCDAMLLKNTETFASTYAERHPEGLDYLIFTQGIATIQGFTPTAEGLDQKTVLHYYSRMSFIHHLLPQMQNKPDARVLSVFSAGVHRPYELFREDVSMKSHYTLQNAANFCGFYNDVGLDAFSREVPNVSFIHSAPGFVNTNWGTEMPFYIRWAVRGIQLFATSIHDCAEYMCDGIMNPAYKGGFHLMTATATEAPKTALHDEARDIVWQHTKEVIHRV